MGIDHYNRFCVRRGTPMCRDDYAVSLFAADLLLGREVKPESADRILRNLGVSTLTAVEAISKANNLADENRERLKDMIERNDPELIFSLSNAMIRARLFSETDECGEFVQSCKDFVGELKSLSAAVFWVAVGVLSLVAAWWVIISPYYFFKYLYENDYIEVCGIGHWVSFTIFFWVSLSCVVIWRRSLWRGFVRSVRFVRRHARRFEEATRP